MNVKELFEKAENGVLTYEQFEAAAKANNAKFADLNEGNYVSKSKYSNDLASKDDQIRTLNENLTSRDADLTDLKTKLESAGADSAKLASITNDFTELQNKYDEAAKSYEARLNKQAYEFAVKEFAATKKFTSNAARRDFTQSMIAENLQLKDDKILGAEEFVTSYTENNADAFVKEEEAGAEPPVPEGQKKPIFSGPTGAQSNQGDVNPFAQAFNFTPIHPVPKKE